MFSLLFFALLVFALVAAFAVARRFTRERLRFVTAVQRPSAPLVAGAGALAVGALLALFLPVVGFGSALGLAAAVAVGVSTGARDIRRGAYWVTGG